MEIPTDTPRPRSTADASSSSVTLGASAMSVPHVNSRSSRSVDATLPRNRGRGEQRRQNLQEKPGFEALRDKGRPRSEFDRHGLVWAPPRVLVEGREELFVRTGLCPG